MSIRTPELDGDDRIASAFVKPIDSRFEELSFREQWPPGAPITPVTAATCTRPPSRRINPVFSAQILQKSTTCNNPLPLSTPRASEVISSKHRRKVGQGTFIGGMNMFAIIGLALL